MALEPVEVTLRLVDDKVQFDAVSKTRPNSPVRFDYAPPFGSGDGFVGIEMLTMSFAGCVSTAIVGLLRRRGKTLMDYGMTILGHKHEQPLYLEAIMFTVHVTSPDATEQDMAEVLALAEKISPAWLAMKGNVAITGQAELSRP